jgi:hypothetical protein
MKSLLINLFVLLFLTTSVNASTNSNENYKLITKDSIINSLNLETFDNFLTSIESFQIHKPNFFKIPNEKNINKIKSQFLFENRFSNLDLILRFRNVAATQPEYLFEIYQIVLAKTKNLNYIKDDSQNLLSNDELLIAYFTDELMTILGLYQESNTHPGLDNEVDTIRTCMDGEDCPPHVPGEEYTKMLSMAGAVYGATLSDYGPMYAGTTKTYNSALATTWSGRQEYKNINLDRDLFSYFHESYTDSTFLNPYNLLGVNDAYAYGLSGNGITVNVTVVFVQTIQKLLEKL